MVYEWDARKAQRAFWIKLGIAVGALALLAGIAASYLIAT